MRDGFDIEATIVFQSLVCVPLLPRKLFPEARRLELTLEVMQGADLNPTLRPTELTIPQISALCDAYAHLCTREPDLHSYDFREELKLKHQCRRRTTPVDTPSAIQVSPPQC